MKTKPATIRKQAKQLIGQPVCIVLNDGSRYIGCITRIEKDGLILSGKRGEGKRRRPSPHRSKKVKTSGLLSAFTGGAGPFNFSPVDAGAAEGGGFGGLGGFMGFIGFIQKAWPAVNMGFKMIKTIMPLFGGFKALNG